MPGSVYAFEGLTLTTKTEALGWCTLPTLADSITAVPLKWFADAYFTFMPLLRHKQKITRVRTAANPSKHPFYQYPWPTQS